MYQQHCAHNIAELYCLNIAWHLQIKYAEPEKLTVIHCKKEYAKHFEIQPIEFTEQHITIRIKLLDSWLSEFPEHQQEVGKVFIILLLIKSVHVQDPSNYYLVCHLTKNSSSQPYLIHLDSFPMSVINSPAFINFSTLSMREIIFTVHAYETNKLVHTGLLCSHELLLRTIISHPDYEVPHYLKYYTNHPYIGWDIAYYQLRGNWHGKSVDR